MHRRTTSRIWACYQKRLILARFSNSPWTPGSGGYACICHRYGREPYLAARAVPTEQYIRQGSKRQLQRELNDARPTGGDITLRRTRIGQSLSNSAIVPVG